MASVVHCLYCFESLAAHLERRKAVSLEAIQASWPDYLASLGDKDAGAAAANDAGAPAGDGTGESASATLAKQIPALRRLNGTASAPASAASSSSDSGASSASASTLSLAPDTPATSTSSLSYAAAAAAVAAAASPTDEYPLFVTWNTLEDPDADGGSGEHALRGCIGTFEALELADGLASYAVTAAVRDTRFDPVTAAELPSLQVAVTLLTDFEDCADKLDWTVGLHGLRISFSYHGRRHGATYLPDVAAEQGWTKEETLKSLMRKAGWMGRRDRWHEVELKCVRYQGKKESLDYADYKRWRDWMTAKKKAAA